MWFLYNIFILLYSSLTQRFIELGNYSMINWRIIPAFISFGTLLVISAVVMGDIQELFYCGK